jgi:hypothetical protein
MLTMNRRERRWKARIALFVVCVTSATDVSAATLQAKTLRGWETYVQATEKRIDDETSGGPAFLLLDFKPPDESARIHKLLEGGRVYVERMRTKDARGKEIKADDGMIHHWYGSILVPHVRLETLIRWLQNYDRHSEYFSEVEESKLVSHDGENFRIFLRLMRKKIVTVHYNTDHSVVYRHQTRTRVSSRSIADRIAEVSDAGTAEEKEKTSADDSGFLWRLNSYWRFEETDSGVIVECESISLSRTIPFGFGWLIGPFVESVPRESLNNMLISIRDGVTSGGRKNQEETRLQPDAIIE